MAGRYSYIDSEYLFTERREIEHAGCYANGSIIFYGHDIQQQDAGAQPTLLAGGGRATVGVFCAWPRYDNAIFCLWKCNWLQFSFVKVVFPRKFLQNIGWNLIPSLVCDTLKNVGCNSWNNLSIWFVYILHPIKIILRFDHILLRNYSRWKTRRSKVNFMPFTPIFVK